MHIVIMGCGRTGATLATEFEARGHTVAVIDQSGDAFRRLPSTFKGQRITGIGFDRDTLVSAGVEDAYGFAAVSDGDNSNILAARVVRETYGVDNVVARIADSGRAEVYRRLGIPTVAPVPWTAEQIVSRLLPGGTEDLYADPSAGVSLRRLQLHEGWVGRPYTEVQERAHARLAYLLRFGEAMLPGAGTVVQEGDEAYFVLAPRDGIDPVRVTGQAPEVKR
ncbi:TrkA family potassium uptake protein [Demequina sp. SYSU T00068]|uniref:potassium channel family protein n=1 Tax=Demequina lignilytica TaxID=3051663 RepID=UPI00261AA9B0|nr:TrkA family potassium uptake protein [Demequina sp. SYSU T00068]MDN4489462.1 TrkA family potassium uptake protein [Demequina sp. SYSU T00068]